VIVVVEESGTESTHRIAHLTEAPLNCPLLKSTVAVITPEGICLLGKVGYKNILIAVSVNILGIDSHAAARLSVWIKSTVRLQRYFTKRPVTVVTEKKIRRCIIRLEYINASIVVVVKRDYAKALADVVCDT